MSRGILNVDFSFLHTIMRLPEDVEIESISTDRAGYASFILKGDSMPDNTYDVKLVKATTHNAEAWTEITGVDV